MAIQVNFYNNSSANNIAHKNIGSVVSQQNCNLFSECSITNPILLVDLANANLKNANYCYIPNFNRYYYIVDNTIYNGNKLKLTLKVDVLMSFYNSFSNSRCIAKRSSSHPNPDIPDNLAVYKQQSKFIRRKDTNKFTPSSSAGCYILTVGGK